MVHRPAKLRYVNAGGTVVVLLASSRSGVNRAGPRQRDRCCPRSPLFNDQYSRRSWKRWIAPAGTSSPRLRWEAPAGGWGRPGRPLRWVTEGGFRRPPRAGAPSGRSEGESPAERRAPPAPTSPSTGRWARPAHGDGCAGSLARCSGCEAAAASGRLRSTTTHL